MKKRGEKEKTFPNIPTRVRRKRQRRYANGGEKKLSPWGREERFPALIKKE